MSVLSLQLVMFYKLPKVWTLENSTCRREGSHTGSAVNLPWQPCNRGFYNCIFAIWGWRNWSNLHHKCSVTHLRALFSALNVPHFLNLPFMYVFLASFTTTSINSLVLTVEVLNRVKTNEILFSCLIYLNGIPSSLICILQLINRGH